MKTCKDCIYFSKQTRINVFDAESYYANCRLYPDYTEKYSNHWCGQFKQSNIWKQQQDLKQPDDELRDYTLNRLRELDKEYTGIFEDKLSPESRKLNQELLRQYQQKVTELKELLK